MKYKFLNFNIHNFTILFVILSIYYIFYNTGLHGDDYSVIREYDKNSFKFFSINPISDQSKEFLKKCMSYFPE